MNKPECKKKKKKKKTIRRYLAMSDRQTTFGQKTFWQTTVRRLKRKFDTFSAASSWDSCNIIKQDS